MVMKSIEVNEVVCECFGGSDIFEAVREATILALTEHRRVSFKHNGVNYLIHPKEIIGFTISKCNPLKP